MSIQDKQLLLLSRLTPLYYEKFGDAYNRADCQDKLLYKNQIRAVMVIGNRGQLSASLLGKLLTLRKSSITSLVDSLIEKNFVKRETDTLDRRKCLLSLTEEGLQYREEKYNTLHIEMRPILEKLSDDEIKSLFDALDTVTAIFKKL